MQRPKSPVPYKTAVNSFELGDLLPQQSFIVRAKGLTDQLESSDEEEKHRSGYEALRIKIKHFLEYNLVGQLYSQIVLILSLLTSIQYIYYTYTTLESNMGTAMYSLFLNIDLIIAVFFLFDWALNWFIAEHKKAYIFRSECNVLEIIFIIQSCFLKFFSNSRSYDSDSCIRNI